MTFIRLPGLAITYYELGTTTLKSRSSSLKSSNSTKVSFDIFVKILHFFTYYVECSSFHLSKVLSPSSRFVMLGVLYYEYVSELAGSDQEHRYHPVYKIPVIDRFCAFN